MIRTHAEQNDWSRRVHTLVRELSETAAVADLQGEAAKEAT